MPFEKFVDIDTITKERSEAIRKSLRRIEIDELKKLADTIFHLPDDPWRATLLRLIAERPHGSYYHAVTSDHAIFLYCRDEDLGLWISPGGGMGPLRERGKRLMKDAIDHSQ
jgi:hypothetical protein